MVSFCPYLPKFWLLSVEFWYVASERFGLPLHYNIFIISDYAMVWLNLKFQHHLQRSLVYLYTITFLLPFLYFLFFQNNLIYIISDYTIVWLNFNFQHHLQKGSVYLYTITFLLSLLYFWNYNPSSNGQITSLVGAQADL